MHHVAPQLHVTFRRLRSARSSTRHSRHTRFSPFFLFFSFLLFDHLLHSTTSSSTLSLFLFRSLPPSLSSSRADFLEFVSSPRSSPLDLPTSSSSPSLFIFYSLRVFSSAAFPSDGFVGKRAPVDRPPRPPVHADRSASVASLLAARDHARSLARPEDPGRCRPG